MVILILKENPFKQIHKSSSDGLGGHNLGLIHPDRMLFRQLTKRGIKHQFRKKIKLAN